MCVSLLDSETLAALGTTTGEHGTTTLSGHTGTEAMGLGTLTLIRLIRTLHLKFLLLHFECPRGRGRRYRHVSLKIVGKSMFKCQEIKGKRLRSSHGSPISTTEICGLMATFHDISSSFQQVMLAMLRTFRPFSKVFNKF